MLVESKHYWSFCNTLVIACMIVLASRSISKSGIHKRVLFLQQQKIFAPKNALGSGCPLQQKWPTITGCKKPSVHSFASITTWRHKAINSQQLLWLQWLLYYSILIFLHGFIFLVNLTVIPQENLVNFKSLFQRSILLIQNFFDSFCHR